MKGWARKGSSPWSHKSVPNGGTGFMVFYLCGAMKNFISFSSSLFLSISSKGIDLSPCTVVMTLLIDSTCPLSCARHFIMKPEVEQAVIYWVVEHLLNG